MSTTPALSAFAADTVRWAAFADELHKEAGKEEALRGSPEREAATGAGALAAGAVAGNAALPRLTGRQTVYHGTTSASADAIRKNGLRPSNHGGSVGVINAHGYPTEWADKAYVATNKTKAQLYAAQAGTLRPREGKGVILEASVPTWKKGLELQQNPETAGGYKQWAGRTRDRLQQNLSKFKEHQPAFLHDLAEHQAAQGMKATEGMSGRALHAFQSWGEHAVEGLPAEHIRGSSTYKRLGAREVGEYIRARPGRFASGAALATGALAAGAFGAKKLWSAAHPAAAQGGAKTAGTVEVAHSFHPVVVQPPQALRKPFPFTGFIDFQGIKIDVENKKGEYRKGKAKDGTEWKVLMHSHYGEIRDTEGTDGDKLDVYVGPNHDSSLVVVVRQLKPDTGAFDEDKVMLGYDSVEEAIGAYKKQYDKPGFYKAGGHKVMPIGQFWRWVHDRKNYGKKVASLRDYTIFRKKPVVDEKERAAADARTKAWLDAGQTYDDPDHPPGTKKEAANVLDKVRPVLQPYTREFALHPHAQKALGGAAVLGGLVGGYKYHQNAKKKELETGNPSVGRHALEYGVGGAIAGAAGGAATSHRARGALAAVRDAAQPHAAYVMKIVEDLRSQGTSTSKIKDLLKHPGLAERVAAARIGASADILHKRIHVGKSALVGAAALGLLNAGAGAYHTHNNESLRADLRGEQRRLRVGRYASTKEAGASPLSAAGAPTTPSIGLAARDKMQKTAPPHYSPPGPGIHVAPSPWTKSAGILAGLGGKQGPELPGVGDEGERPKVQGMKQPRLATPRLNPDQGKHIPTNPFRGSWKKLGGAGAAVHEAGEVARRLTDAIPEKVKHGILGAGVVAAGGLGLKATADQVVNPHPEGVGLGAGARAGQKALTLGLSRAGSGPVQY